MVLLAAALGKTTKELVRSGSLPTRPTDLQNDDPGEREEEVRHERRDVA
jgi:hypothetical protein